MTFCRNCGAEIDEKAVSCPTCGASKQADTESIAFIYGILGAIIPIAGLVLFLVWKDTKPKPAKAAGIGTLIGFIIWLVRILV